MGRLACAGCPQQNGRTARKEANRRSDRAIPGPKVRTWGTQDWRDGEWRMRFLIARREPPRRAKRKCTPERHWSVVSGQCAGPVCRSKTVEGTTADSSTSFVRLRKLRSLRMTVGVARRLFVFVSREPEGAGASEDPGTKSH